jgi:hypothetical protein
MTGKKRYKDISQRPITYYSVCNVSNFLTLLFRKSLPLTN